MGDPFVGYARDPGNVTDATPDDLASAIASASERYGVPAEILQRVRAVESGGAVDPYQEVGYNSAGYGGFFGLPRALLGTVQQQADASARALAQAFSRTGSWEDALSIYRTGSPGQGYPDGATVSPSAAAPSGPASSAWPAGQTYLMLIAAVIFFVLVVV